ncbi:helix-turn-helix domain-containing protein [Kluyvera sp. STS39-E]|uniref:helix-turn-helix domain-containing protein n=1 Tax=Kluyvera sp. STS39-E TaxID=3234748 RepID=UPI0034C64707
MEIKLHANATTTPRVRRYLQESDKNDRELARELGISVTTVRRWRNREQTADRSTTPVVVHKAMRQEQVILINALREILQAPLDDLLFMVVEGLEIPLSRATLSRYLKPSYHRGGSEILCGKKALKAGHKAQSLTLHYRFMSLHMDDDGDHHLLWAREPVSGWCYARVYSGMSPSLVVNWLDEVLAQFPGDIQSVEMQSNEGLSEGLDQRLADRGIIGRVMPVENKRSAVQVTQPLAEIIPAVRVCTPDELAVRLCFIFNTGKQQKKLGNMTPQAFLEALRP